MAVGPYRRADLAEAKRKSRAAARAAEAEGRPKPHADAVREALADAAMIVLAVDGPGHEEIMRLVAGAFPATPALPLTLRAKIRSGRLRPRRLTPDVVRATIGAS